MKSLHINTGNVNGGATRAAYRIHTGLRAAGIVSSFLSREPVQGDNSVIAPHGWLGKLDAVLRPEIERAIFRMANRGKRAPFSPAWFPFGRGWKVLSRVDPDIVHLHWIAGGLMSPRDISHIGKPVVWTMHDMWPFTGGCHYSGECRRYRNGCRDCPILSNRGPRDLSNRLFNSKLDAWRESRFALVSPSQWLADRATESALFEKQRITVIPNGLETDLFRPGDKLQQRAALGLPPHKKLLLFGAVNATGDQRKGFQFLPMAMQRLGQDLRKNIELVVYGSSEPRDPPDFGLPVHYLGNIQDDTALASLYSSVDAMLVPSREDNLPNSAVEAISCGTPVVAFRVGGLADIVDHKQNGYLANTFSADDLAHGIEWVLADDSRIASLSERARSKAVAKFDLGKVAGAYRSLYESLL